MKRAIKWVCSSAMALLAFSIAAVADETITATDGRSFLLRSNGTFEEIKFDAAKDAVSETALTDLKLDIKNMDGQRVAVRGKLIIVGDIAMLSDPKEVMDMTSVSVNLDGLPRDQRKQLLTKCGSGCKLKVTGTVGAVLFQPGIIAEDVSFK